MRPRAAFLLALAAACAAPAPVSVVPAAWRLADEVAVHPTLAEIFLDVPPQGAPLEVVSVSADARFALLSWRAPGAPEAELCLADARAPAAAGAGRPLRALLPPAGAEPEPALATAWTKAGCRLALGRGGDVWLLDAESGVLAPLASWEPAPAEEPAAEEAAPPQAVAEEQAIAEEDAPAAPAAPPAAAQEPAAEAPEAGRLGAVEHLAFTPDGRHLRIGDGRELLELPVPPEAPARALALDEGTWWSLDVEAPAKDLAWSDDLTVVCGLDPLPRAEAAPEAQVWRVLERRAVVLEGLAALGKVEEQSLSPDGRYFFGVEVERAAEPAPTEVPDFLTPRVSHREGRRLLADDRPSPARLWVWDTASGARAELLFEAPAEGVEAARFHVEVVGWTRPAAGPPVLCLERLSEDYRELSLWTWCEGELRRVHAERDPAWIGGPARDTRLEPGGLALLIGSELAPGTTTPGRSQVFRIELASGALRQLTQVAGEVTDFAALEDGGVLVVASEDDPGQRTVALLPAESVRGGEPADLRAYALPAGFVAEAHASADGARVLALHENLLAPPELYVADFERAQALTRATPDAFRALELVRPERLIVRAPDGADVYAHVYLPPGVPTAGGGPARASVVFLHGAGYLQNVSDSMTRYPQNALFHARLARLGYVVVDVDYRGSAGYGRSFRTGVQHHLGGQDLADVHLVVDELVARGLVDGRRVACYGGSYGGFLTLMALFTAPERWAAGCALRSVTDWRTYHPDYAQPRLGRPSTDPEAYARSSPIDHVAGLRDPLLVLHGMVDTNVFAQDSIRLIEALIDAGKEFDAMLYPSQGHAFEDGTAWLDQYRRIERFLIAHLGPPLAEGGGAHGFPEAAWIGGSYCPYPFNDGDDGHDGNDDGALGPSAAPSSFEGDAGLHGSRDDASTAGGRGGRP